MYRILVCDVYHVSFVTLFVDSIAIMKQDQKQN